MNSIKVSHYKIKINNSDNKPLHPFSIVILSDLHNAVFGAGNKELLQLIRQVDPKFVLSSGDLVVAKGNHYEKKAAEDLLGELTRRYPVYCVNGNHESRMAAHSDKFQNAYESYIQKICGLGVQLLQNSVKCTEVNGMRLAIWGYELPWEYYGHGRFPKMPAEEIKQILGEPQKDAYNILLAHHPHYFSAYADWGADMTFAGHYHGGMVRLPWLGGVISPGWTLFPKYDHGLYKKEDKKMIVSAGLAAHTIKLRINNPPELVVADFV